MYVYHLINRTLKLLFIMIVFWTKFNLRREGGRGKFNKSLSKTKVTVNLVGKTVIYHLIYTAQFNFLLVAFLPSFVSFFLSSLLPFFFSFSLPFIVYGAKKRKRKERRKGCRKEREGRGERNVECKRKKDRGEGRKDRGKSEGEDVGKIESGGKIYESDI